MKITMFFIIAILTMAISLPATGQDADLDPAIQKVGQTGSRILRLGAIEARGPGAEKTAETTGHAAEPLDPELEALLKEALAAEE